MIRFRIDDRKKKVIHQKFIRSKPALYLCPFMFVFLAVAFSAIVLIYSLTDGSVFVIRDIMEPDYGAKDFVVVSFVIGTADIVFLFLALISKIAVKRITGRNLSERINESLIYENHVLMYGYQNYAGSTEDDRVIVRIPLERQRQIIYKKDAEQICFSGFYSSAYYEDYRTGQTRADGSFTEGNFVLFDYFTPSLANTLKSIGMEVMELG